MNNVEKYIKKLIEKDELWKFYKSREWKLLKKSILEENHYECKECRKRGIINRHDTDKKGNPVLISTVHHNFFVRDYPEFALSRTVMVAGEEKVNLIPVCKACHNRLHPEKRRKMEAKKKKGYVNEEWW